MQWRPVPRPREEYVQQAATKSLGAAPLMYTTRQDSEMYGQGTASPPGQAWGPFPDGTEGGLVPATDVSDIAPCVQTSVNIHPASHQQLGIDWLVEDLLDLLRTHCSLPLQEGGISIT